MKINRLVIEAVIAGLLIAASALLGLERAAGLAPPNANSTAPDTATIERLTHAYHDVEPIGLQSTTDVTGTNAAILAAGLLLNQPFYAVDLPVVVK